jgi:hypothetical protein
MPGTLANPNQTYQSSEDAGCEQRDPQTFHYGSQGRDDGAGSDLV